MKKIKAYIESGSLEQHCFDLSNAERAKEVAELSASHPEVRQELNEIEQTIELLAQSYAIEPDDRLRGRLLNVLGFAGDEQLDINNLPTTGKYSDPVSWLNAVEHLLPAEPFEDFFQHILRQDEQIAQMLVITRLNVPPEIHEDVAESFFILKGQCTCTIGDKRVILTPGDHLDIPLHVSHDVKIDSPYVIAILQHQFS
ncbi:cupin domain-containing protein [Mucilaginibacter ginsenosidivorans]|uniref:Cupin domain-containing protein n=1 Tax=Mucilaginibacter ginsenosidivorans TaxID=398053 RepID=A0A5B8UX10_9SPHI|nr:cupin domain-containing protein [Mucilaginibacter ginsenosidivorans]QEC63697.1 cupin domain-containing protein [Mucilaginibacter ginsenosidivorans]